jgi:hypothetical protein
MNKVDIPQYFDQFIKAHNPSTEIGTSEFLIYTSLGLFRKRGETVAHCLMNLYNEKMGDFKIYSWELVYSSKIK